MPTIADKYLAVRWARVGILQHHSMHLGKPMNKVHVR